MVFKEAIMESHIVEIKIRDYIKSDFQEVSKDATSEEKELYLKRIGFEQHPKGGYEFYCNTFARFFLKNTDVVSLSNEEELALYNQKKGVYELKCEQKLGKIIKFMMNQVLDLWIPSHEQLALKAIRRDVSRIATAFNNGEYINLQDGILNLDDFELYEHSPEFLSTVQLPFKYNDRMYTPVFDKYIADIVCGNYELEHVLQELLGYCLCTSTVAEKAFFLVGGGCNGKSVFAKLIQMLVGEGNYSNTSLSALSGTFGLAQLINSNVNISAENSSGKVNSEIFKAVVSGDTCEVNRKYKDALSVKLHTKLVLLFNTLPECDDLSYGFFRKILIIPFNKTITKENIDVELIDKLEHELSGIFHWALKGLQRLRKNNFVFSQCAACKRELDKYKRSLNPVAEYIVFNLNPKSENSMKRSDIYKAYTKYCYDNSVEVLQCQKFWKLYKAYYTDRGIPFVTCKIKGYEYVRGVEFAK